MTDIFFVWISGMRGPTPQIWHGEMTEGGKAVEVLAKRELAEDEVASGLDELAVKYPLGGRR